MGKNRKQRHVTLTNVARILVRKLLKEGFWKADQPFLFPMRSKSADRTNREVSKATIWRLCARIFRRSNVTGPTAHPHTFRHTFVHMLYLGGGNSFEVIARFIGHAHPKITEKIYGRIHDEESRGSIRGMPFLSEIAGRDVKAEWEPFAAFISCPWEYTGHLWDGMRKVQGSDKSVEEGREAVREKIKANKPSQPAQ